MTTATVTLTGVSKHYGPIAAVRDVDLSLAPGERIALVGHNGAGKSTLIKLMLGLVRPTAGTIDLLGENPAAGAAAAKARIGYLPENLVMPPAMTGAELMNFYARLKRRDVAANGAILERVGLVEAAGRRVDTYSKGMRQRLGLAQALIGTPRLMLLDEPTSGLDPALRQKFYDIMSELARGGATVLISSHALAELESQADRVVVMNRGRKVADGSIAELRQMAERPVKIRVTLAGDGLALLPDALGPSVTWREAGARTVEIHCKGGAKVETLRRLAASPLPIEDIEIAESTLDDIYAHFLRRDEPREAAE